MDSLQKLKKEILLLSRDRNNLQFVKYLMGAIDAIPNDVKLGEFIRELSREINLNQ